MSPSEYCLAKGSSYKSGAVQCSQVSPGEISGQSQRHWALPVFPQFSWTAFRVLSLPIPPHLSPYCWSLSLPVCAEHRKQTNCSPKHFCNTPLLKSPQKYQITTALFMLPLATPQPSTISVAIHMTSLTFCLTQTDHCLDNSRYILPSQLVSPDDPYCFSLYITSLKSRQIHVYILCKLTSLHGFSIKGNIMTIILRAFLLSQSLPNVNKDGFIHRIYPYIPKSCTVTL